MKKTAISFLIMLSLAFQLKAQKDLQNTLDSLKQALIEKQEGKYSLTAISRLYVQIGRTYESLNNDSAIVWYQKQAGFLKNSPLQSPKKDSLIGSTYLDISYLLSFIGYPVEEDVDMALRYSDSAFTIFEAAGEYEMAIRAFNNKGLALINQNRYEEAIKNLIQALELSDQIAKVDKRDMALQGLYLNIGKAYIGLEQWSEALNNTKKSLDYPQVPRFEMIALNNLAAIYLEIEEADSALEYAIISYHLADSLADDYHRLLNKVNQAEAYIMLEKYSAALPIIDSIIAMSRAFDYPYGIAAGLNQKAHCYAERQDFDQALEFLNEAEKLVFEVADKELLLDTWSNLQELHYRMGNYELAYQYQQQFFNLKDSLNSVAKTRSFNNLLLRYQSAEKEKQITLQDLDLRAKEASLAKRDRQITIIVAAVLLLFLAVLIFIFRYRQMQERKLQKALITEKEKGLKAIISVTEQERKRISKDLHDGIGQKLTALRFGLINLKAKFSDKDLQAEVDGIAKEFSQSAEELRHISHQMMPRALMEQGLVQALEDLMESTFKYSEIDYSFDYFKVEKRYNEQIEVSMYRIAQELLNNALKHAQASEIHLQLMELEGSLILIVEDNGKGFKDAQNKGQGLYNIKSRLDVLKGIVNYEPGPQTGMLATVKIPVI